MTRRAEIGRERRERTRDALLTAAKGIFSESPLERVSVDDVVVSAGVAKGTFYYHFRDFDALIAAIGETLALEFDALLQPHRLLLQNPLERFAWGQLAFLRKAESEPRWGRLVHHAKFTDDSAAAAEVRDHMHADLEAARTSGLLTAFETPFAVRLVLAMATEYLGRLDDPSSAVPPPAALVEAILRALGVVPDAAASITAKVGSIGSPASASEAC